LSFTTLLNITAYFYTKTNTGNNVVPNYQNVLIKSVSGRLSKLSEHRVVRDDGGRIIADYILFIDYTTGLSLTNIVSINGEEFTIYSMDNIDNMNHHIEMYLLKQQPGVEIGDS
jgi:hypothetical protein